jgi:hypothetical protein
VVVLYMPNRNVVGQQGALEAKAAADQEAHHVVFPERGDIADFLLQNSVAIDPVFRKVTANVGSRRCPHGLAAAWVGHIE